jgi:hypothetical protein
MPSQKHGAIGSYLKTNASRPSPSLDETLCSALKADADVQGWQDAVERMLLYLKSLKVTPEEQLGLALEASRRAGTQRHEPTDPLPVCLEALWQILQERCMPMTTRIDIGANNGNARAASKLRTVFSSMQTYNELAHPTMRRQCMISAHMELAPWRRRIQEIITAVRGPTEALLYRCSQVLGTSFALIALITFKQTG